MDMMFNETFMYNSVLRGYLPLRLPYVLIDAVR